MVTVADNNFATNDQAISYNCGICNAAAGDASYIANNNIIVFSGSGIFVCFTLGLLLLIHAL